MGAEEGGVGEETTVTTTMSGLGSAPDSPKNKVKFLCSHGGKILPRPADGHLKYVGGETRVVSVPRDINFSELMKKLASLSDGDIVLKYQLIPEDLDTLVSVKSNEDLRHMLDEHDRHETAGTPRLRAFLFPANPLIMENQTSSIEPHALEQRYIDAVNGIIRTTTAGVKQSSASVGSSPKSPESCTTEALNHEIMPPKGFQKSQVGMHRVRSSPAISSLSSQHYGNPHLHHHQYYQLHHHQGLMSPRAHPPESLASVRSVGRADSWKYQVLPGPNNYYPVARHNRGCYCSKRMHFDEYGAYVDRKSLSRSPPLTRSPL